MGFKIPQNGDFSVWEKQLNGKISGCSHRVSVGDMKLGRTMFSWLDDTNAAKTLANYLDDTMKTSMNDYTSKRWYGIFIIVLGILALIGAALIAWFARKRRKVFGQKPVYADKVLRPTTRQRALLRAVSWVLVLLALTSSILVIVGSSQMLKGAKRVECNGWLPIHAHYFGAKGLESGKSLAEPVSLDWKGTVAIKKQLEALALKTVPAEENPVRQLLVAQKGMGVKNMTMADGLIRTYYTAARKTMENHVNNLYKQMWPQYGLTNSEVSHNFDHARMRGAMENLYADWAVYEGDQRLQYVLDRYTAPNAFLMNTAYNAVQEALETINQIDRSIGEFAKSWDKMVGKLNDTGKSIAAFGIIFALLTIAFACWAQMGTLKLSQAVRRGVYPGLKFEKKWRRIVVYAFVGFAVSLTFFGINLLVAAIGNDACKVLDQDLLQEGRWSLMPEAVLYPNTKEKSTLDMVPVLDTCVRRGGDGSVALTMGLDGRIAEVAAHVEQAEAELHSQIGAFAARQTRTARAKYLRKVYRNALLTVNRASPTSSKPTHSFPQVRNLFIVPVKGLVGSPAEFAFNVAAGKSEILFGLTVATTLPYTGLFFQYDNPDAGYKFANELAATIHSNFPAPEGTPLEEQFPHGFCSAFAKSQGVSCYLPSEAPAGERWVDLSEFAKPDEPVALAQLANTTGQIPADWTYANQNSEVVARTGTLLEELWRGEKLRNHVFEHGVQGVDCPNPAAGKCTYAEVLERDIQILQGAGEAAVQAVTAFSDVLEGLVYKVITPVLEGLVEEANAITDDANCQVIGTALDNGVRVALCENFFPGFAISGAFWFILILVFAVATHQAWTWASLMSHADMPGEPDVVPDAEGPGSPETTASAEDASAAVVVEKQPNETKLVSQDEAALTTAVNDSPPHNLTPEPQGKEADKDL